MPPCCLAVVLMLAASCKNGAENIAPPKAPPAVDTVASPTDTPDAQAPDGRAPGPSPFEGRLVPDKTQIMLGEPIYLEFVLRNVTDTDWQISEGGNQRNRLGRFDDYQLVVTDGQGKTLPAIDSSPSFGGIGWSPKVPAKGEYVRELFLPNWVRFTVPGRYTLKSTRAYKSRPLAEDQWFGETGVTHTVVAQVELEVVPFDRAKMGKVIDQFGAGMLGKPGEDRDRSIRLLAAVNDKRVIPWYAKAVRERIYGLKFAAIDGMAKFNEDAALAVIEIGMKTEGKDLDNVTTAKVAAEAADGLRHAAAVSLSRSKHPRAFQLLLSMRKDSAYAVRLTVLQAAGKRATPADKKLIQQMTSDPNEMVRNEAKRFARELK